MTRAYLYSLGTRGIAVFGGLATVELIAQSLDEMMQGLYYGFLSVLGIQVVLEMGLANYLVIRCSHHASNLVWNGRSIQPHTLLAALFKGALRWYSGLVAASFLICLVVGLWAFRENSSQWLWPWIWACTTASLQLSTQPFIALLEGSGRIDEVIRIRLLQTLAVQGGTCAGLVAGAGINAVIYGQVAMLLVTLFCLIGWREVFSLLWRTSVDGCGFNWWREIWPNQWRGAFVWIAVFSIAGLPTILLLKARGEIEAGQWGMARKVFETLLFAGSAIFTTRTAYFGAAYARRDFAILKKKWYKSVLIGVMVTTCGVIGCIGLFGMFGYLGMAFPDRIGTPQLRWILGLLTIVNCANWGVEVLIRSAGTEPLVIQSVCRAIVTAMSLYWAVTYYGINGVAWVLLIVASLMILPWNFILTLSTLRRWRSEL